MRSVIDYQIERPVAFTFDYLAQRPSITLVYPPISLDALLQGFGLNIILPQLVIGRQRQINCDRLFGLKVFKPESQTAAFPNAQFKDVLGLEIFPQAPKGFILAQQFVAFSNFKAPVASSALGNSNVMPFKTIRSACQFIFLVIADALSVTEMYCAAKDYFSTFTFKLVANFPAR
jgi:hypothetical protein